jgi:beta-lactamase class A
VFTQSGLIYDSSIPASAGQPSISRLNTGLDYIHTFGLPSVTLIAGQKIWSLGDTSVLDSPATGQEIAHIGQDFPLALLGKTQWSGGKLWYNVQLSDTKNAHKGWVDNSVVTFTPPGNQAGHASFDALSSDLIAYLNSLGQNVSATLYDETHHVYYTYNTSTPFIVASSMKVPIMLTFFDMIEQQSREPDDNEMNLLTTMIENSNNDSASALFQEVGQSAGISAYMQKIGVTGLSSDDDSWGYSTITSQTMVNLLTLLHDGKILNANHRALTLNLMENVETDQQVGIGDTAPNGATVALKDGWVTGSDGQWAMNSSGIVTTNNETYILSVYTQEQQSLDDGQAIARHVCSTVATLLGS